MLDIKHVYSDRKSIMTMVGELGIDTIACFNEQMALVNSYCPQELVIDFAGMAFMDSTGVRASLCNHRGSTPVWGRLLSCHRHTRIK